MFSKNKTACSKLSLDPKEKTNNMVIGSDKTKIPTAEILCSIEEIPARGKVILSKFRYLGAFISSKGYYIRKYNLSTPCNPFPLS